jgi:general secretion pathway protein K
VNRKSQGGVAIISVILIVVVATVLGVEMITDQSYAISRLTSIANTQQAQQYALGGEELARQILHQDFVDSPGKDDLTEVWASNELNYEFDNGEISLQIEDLQGRLNVNALAGANESGVTRTRLINLVALHGIDIMYVDRMLDWIDLDNSKSEIGAEDWDYLGLDRPYRTAGQKMADISELRLLLDMTPETFDQLSPYLATLPAENVPLNVNTASVEVIKSLAPEVSIESAQGIVQLREQNGGYESVEQFLQDPSFAGLNINASGLGVQSMFFQVNVRARYLDRYTYLTSVVQRDSEDGSMRVIYRDLSKKITPIVTEPNDG